MKELISVIVPVYNVREYLRECIESIINQTYANLEVLLVDDGSTDGSAEICDAYKLKDSRIQVIHKKNGGLSSARNKGIESAKGIYISFVDSDDWLESDFYQILYDSIKMTKAEIATCGRYLVSSDLKEANYCRESSKIYSRKDALREIFELGSIDVAAWDKLYQASLFEQVRFPEGEINEDTAVIYDIFSNVKKVIHVGKPLYNYRLRLGSISKSVYSVKFDVVINHCRDLEENIRKNDPDLLGTLKIYITHLCYTMLVKISRTDKKLYKNQFKEYFELFKKGWKVYIASEKVSNEDKIRCLMLRFHIFDIAHCAAKILKEHK